MDTLDGVDADDDVAQRSAILEDEHGQRSRPLHVEVAEVPSVELLVGKVSGPGDDAGLRQDGLGAAGPGDGQGLGDRVADEKRRE